MRRGVIARSRFRLPKRSAEWSVNVRCDATLPLLVFEMLRRFFDLVVVCGFDSWSKSLATLRKLRFQLPTANANCKKPCALLPR